MKNIDKISVKELTTAKAYGIIGTENDGSQSVANSDEQKTQLCKATAVLKNSFFFVGVGKW